MPKRNKTNPVGAIRISRIIGSHRYGCAYRETAGSSNNKLLAWKLCQRDPMSGIERLLKNSQQTISQRPKKMPENTKPHPKSLKQRLMPAPTTTKRYCILRPIYHKKISEKLFKYLS